jgi:hypothetical protein
MGGGLIYSWLEVPVNVYHNTLPCPSCFVKTKTLYIQLNTVDYSISCSSNEIVSPIFQA